MALLVFPPNPNDGQLYPVTPVVGQNQYQWDGSNLTWRLLGAATGATPGIYCAGETFVPKITVDAVGRITFIECVELTGFVKLNSTGAYNNYVWPSGVGLAGQVLQTDAAGNLSWQYPGVGQAPGLGLFLDGANLKLSVPTQSSPPVAGSGVNQAIPGSLYWDNTLGQLFIYYDDGVTAQWVGATPIPDTSAFVRLNNAGAYNSYVWPNSDGPANAALVTNGSGTLSWSTQATGSVASVATGAGLTGGPITTTGTISLLPASATAIGGVIPDNVTVKTTTTGLLYAVNTGTVTSVDSGVGLSGGPITSSGTINLDPATTANLGGVIPDGTTITVSPTGVITSATVTSVAAGAGISVSSATGAVTISNTSPSDARDKQNIRDNALGLDFVNDLRTTYFEWNFRKTEQDKGKPNVGFIAQEIQEVVAKHDAQALNLVDESDPEFLKLSMVNFMPVAIKAIQELTEKYDAKIAELEAEIAALKAG